MRRISIEHVETKLKWVGGAQGIMEEGGVTEGRSNGE